MALYVLIYVIVIMRAHILGYKYSMSDIMCCCLCTCSCLVPCRFHVWHHVPFCFDIYMLIPCAILFLCLICVPCWFCVWYLAQYCFCVWYVCWFYVRYMICVAFISCLIPIAHSNLRIGSINTITICLHQARMRTHMYKRRAATFQKDSFSPIFLIEYATFRSSKWPEDTGLRTYAHIHTRHICAWMLISDMPTFIRAHTYKVHICMDVDTWIACRPGP